MTRYVILASALAGGAATFLPWEHYDNFVSDGWHASGTISFVVFCLALAAALYKPVWFVRVGLVVAGMVTIAVAAKAIGRVGAVHETMASSWHTLSRKEAERIRVGTGAWLVIAASVGLFFGGLVWRLPRPGQPPAELPRATARPRDP